jgi:carbonic anhydrase/acetyltransferase-like protein (isoleucine patch superfamily)
LARQTCDARFTHRLTGEKVEMPKENKLNIDPTALVHSTAILEGNITIGAFTQIGAGTVLTGTITIGHHTLVECNVVIRGNNKIGDWCHIYDLVNIEGGRPGNHLGGVTSEVPDSSTIGNYCWVNHGATMHGSQLADGAIVDINACLDYNCRIGPGSLVANGSAVRFDSVIPAHCLVEGVPAKIVKENLTDEEIRAKMGLLPAEWLQFAGEAQEKRIREIKGL